MIRISDAEEIVIGFPDLESLIIVEVLSRCRSGIIDNPYWLLMAGAALIRWMIINSVN